MWSSGVAQNYALKAIIKYYIWISILLYIHQNPPLTSQNTPHPTNMASWFTTTRHTTQLHVHLISHYAHLLPTTLTA